eukprot:gene2479-3067_t
MSARNSDYRNTVDRERDRNRDRYRDRYDERDRDRNRDKDRDRDRDRDGDRDRDREREKTRDRYDDRRRYDDRDDGKRDRYLDDRKRNNEDTGLTSERGRSRGRDRNSDHHRSPSLSRGNSKSKSRSRSRDKKRYRNDSDSESNSSYSSSDDSDYRSSKKKKSESKEERRKRKKEEKRRKELIKQNETPEERRQRRIEKRAKKDEKRNRNGGSKSTSEENTSGYHNSENPFGDSNLMEKFVWKAKKEKMLKSGLSQEEYEERYEKKRREDIQAELEKAKKRREQRELEKQLWEEEKERLTRLKDMESNEELTRKEEEFHLLQACKRSEMRLHDNRPKPIDLIYRCLHMSIDLHYENNEPIQLLHSLNRLQLEEIVAEIREFTFLDTKNLEYWESALTVAEYELAVVSGENPLVGESSGVHQSLVSDVRRILQGKSYDEYDKMEKDITLKLQSGGAMNVEYWETLLKHLKISKASAYVRQTYINNLKNKLSEMETDRLIQKISSDLFDRKDGPRENQFSTNENETTTTTNNNNNNTTTTTSTTTSTTKTTTNNENEEVHIEQKVLSLGKALRRDDGTTESKKDEDTLYQMEADKFMEESEEQFDMEVPLEPKFYSWHDKYRPRKPKFFNRVHTGYDWTKYNKTHYDYDNPPPKVVRGYKFNIFYPDLIDPSKSPQFFVHPSTDNPDTVILRFHAGPPYEDIAFRIVKKEWEQSHRHGYKCVFEKEISLEPLEYEEDDKNQWVFDKLKNKYSLLKSITNLNTSFYENSDLSLQIPTTTFENQHNDYSIESIESIYSNISTLTLKLLGKEESLEDNDDIEDYFNSSIQISSISSSTNNNSSSNNKFKSLKQLIKVNKSGIKKLKITGSTNVIDLGLVLEIIQPATITSLNQLSLGLRFNNDQDSLDCLTKFIGNHSKTLFKLHLGYFGFDDESSMKSSSLAMERILSVNSLYGSLTSLYISIDYLDEQRHLMKFNNLKEFGYYTNYDSTHQNILEFLSENQTIVSLNGSFGNEIVPLFNKKETITHWDIYLMTPTEEPVKFHPKVISLSPMGFQVDFTSFGESLKFLNLYDLESKGLNQYISNSKSLKSLVSYQFQDQSN